MNRSGHGTGDHSVPSSANSTRAIGKPPAGVETISRILAGTSVGSTARNQSTTKMLVAELDHGSETAMATARPSAIRSDRSRSNQRMVDRAGIVGANGIGRAEKTGFFGVAGVLTALGRIDH